MKKSKKCYRDIDRYFRRFKCGKREKALAADNEHKQYIRAKRNIVHLPDAWDDYVLFRPISWKKRCKKKHQYDKHKLSNYELTYFYYNINVKQKLLYKLSTLPNDKWFEICDIQGNQLVDYNIYNAAEELYTEGLVDGECVEIDFIDYFNKLQTYRILLHIRMF